MATRSRAPSRIISRLFSGHPEAIHKGLLDPTSQTIAFTTTIDGMEREGHIERSVADAPQRTTVFVYLERGTLENDYHSRAYSTDSNREWTKCDVFGPKSEGGNYELKAINGVEFPCTRDDITALTNLLSVAKIVSLLADS